MAGVGWRSVLGLCVLPFAACDLVFGLDRLGPLEPPDAAAALDGDVDGIPDALDNCPTIANPGQADTNLDGHGDACDWCPTCVACELGPDHDEDGDQVPDGCDLCPAHVNVDQANADGDGLGDVCDPDAAIQQRLAFFGFMDLAGWFPTGAWTSSGDAAAIAQLMGTRATLTRADLSLSGSSPWRIVVGLRVPTMPSVPADRIGIELVDNTGAVSQGCFVFFSGGWLLSGSVAEPVTISGVIELVLEATPSTITCRVGSVTTTLPSTATYPVTPRWFATIATELTFIDVIQ